MTSLRTLLPTLGLGLLAAAAITVVILNFVQSDDLLLLPDPAHPVAPLVSVQGGHKPHGPGGIYFVDVFQRRATEFDALFPWIHHGASLEKIPQGVTDAALAQANRQEMTASQKIAAAVALRRLGYRVRAQPDGVVVSELFSDSRALTKIEVGDVIVAVRGQPALTVSQLRTQMAPVQPGDSVDLRIRRGTRDLTVRVKTIADPLNKHRAIIGFAPDQAARITLPIKVRINAGLVGGPSAGLAFALEIMEQLGRNVAHGYRVAVTGALNLDGTVEAIGGVKQKTYGARDAHADVFLVPVAGENARDAKRYAHGLRIIPVKSFAQALRALATLPRKG